MKRNLLGPAGTLLTLLVAAILCPAGPGDAKAEVLPAHLRDRGTGVPTSMYGTSVRAGGPEVFGFLEAVLPTQRRGTC